MFLPKQPTTTNKSSKTTPTTSASSIISVPTPLSSSSHYSPPQQPSHKQSSSSSSSLSRPKKRITPTYSSSSPPSSINNNINNQSVNNNNSIPMMSIGTTTHQQQSNNSLFKRLDDDDDGESIGSCSTSSSFEEEVFEEELDYSTGGDEHFEFNENNEEFNDVWKVVEDEEDEEEQGFNQQGFERQPKRRKQKTKQTTTTTIEQVTSQQLYSNPSFMTYFDLSLLFDMMSYSKRSTKNENYSFHYLQNRIVLYQFENRLHFGKLNECDKVSEKMNSGMVQKMYNSSFDLNQFPQIEKGDLKIVNITKNGSFKIVAPVTIHAYFEYDSQHYIILTKDSTILLYPLKFTKNGNENTINGEFLEPIQIYSQNLNNIQISKNNNLILLHGFDSGMNSIYQFNLSKIINLKSSNLQNTFIDFKILKIPQQYISNNNSKNSNLILFSNNSYLLSNIVPSNYGNTNYGNNITNYIINFNSNYSNSNSSNQLISNQNIKKFNIQNFENLKSVKTISNFTFILSNRKIHIHNLTCSIEFNKFEENGDTFMEMAVKKDKYGNYLICTISKYGIVDIYKYEELKNEICLEFRFDLKNLSFFNFRMSHEISQCEYLNFIDNSSSSNSSSSVTGGGGGTSSSSTSSLGNSDESTSCEIIICLKSGDLMRFKPNLFYDHQRIPIKL